MNKDGPMQSKLNLFCAKKCKKRTFLSLQLALVSLILICEAATSKQIVDCRTAYCNEPCECLMDGVKDPENCYKPCICKENVEGERCDRCKKGYYSLVSNNVDGCRKCFCFNVTNSCTTRLSAIQVVSKVENWLVSDVTGHERVRPLVEEAYPTIPDDDAPEKPYYWFAPTTYLGNRREAYNSYLNIQLGVTTPRGDRSGKMLTNLADVIVAGSNPFLRLTYQLEPDSFQLHEMKGLIVRSRILLREHGWSRIDDFGNIIGPAYSGDLANVLRDLRQLMIRASYYTDQVSGVLERVELLLEPRSKVDYSQSSTFIPTTLEMCDCPIGYSGYSCEDCAPGYWRKSRSSEYLVDDNQIEGEQFNRDWSCVPCKCSNHSWSSHYPQIDPTLNPNTCNPVTGECECIHNTKGPACDLCADGFYGDARFGRPNDCKPCGCPLLLPSNNFSPTCVQLSDGDYYCDQCPYPYSGPKCDQCAEGYSGRPELPGGRCLPGGAQPAPSELELVTDPVTTVPPTTSMYPDKFDLTTISPVQCSSNWCVSVLQESCKSMSEPLVYFRFDDLSAATDRYSGFAKRIQSYQEQLRSSTVFIQNRHQFLSHFLAENNFTSSVNYSAQIIEEIEGKVNILLPQISGNYLSGKNTLELLNRIIQKTRQTLLVLDKIEVKPASTIPENPNIYQDGLNLVSEMRKIDLSSVLRRATIENTNSAKFLAKIRFMMDIYENLESLKRKTTRLKLYSEQCEIILDFRVRTALVNWQELNEKTQAKLTSVLPRVEQARSELEALGYVLSEKPKILQNIEGHINRVIDSEQIPVDYKSKIEHYTKLLFQYRNQHSDLSHQYKALYVDPCARKANEITSRLDQAQSKYRSVHQSTRSVIQTLSFYQRLEEITRYVTASMKAVKRRLDSMDIGMSLSDILKACANLKAKSAQSLSSAGSFEEKFVDFKEIAVNSFSKFNRAFDAHELAKKLNQAIDDGLNKMPLSVGIQSQDLIDFTRLLTSGLEMVTRKIHSLNSSLTSDEWIQFEAIKNRWQQERLPIAESIGEAKKEVGRATTMVERVYQTSRDVGKGQTRLDQSLSDLRKRILLARRKASEIRISLTSQPNQNCQRSFDVESEPSTINSISITYALSDDAKNSLLFFVSSSKAKEFMALEMVDKRIRFSWDVGSGTATLQHPMQLMNGNGLDIERWYLITISRVAERVALSVNLIGGQSFGGSASFSTVSPGNATIFDLTGMSRVIIGNVSDDVMLSSHFVSQGFRGCITDVYFDDKAVNLWNFKESRGCRACREGPSEEFEADTYHFDGKSSYSVLPQIARYSNENYLVVLTIKTYDENSLIFFCSDQGTRDYIAISMVQGKVVFSFMDGPDYRLSLSSVLKYNHGEWIRISAERSEWKAILRVEDETIDGQIDRDLVQSDLSDCMVHFGGVPPNFTGDIWPELVFKPFKGCMKDVQVDATVLNLLAGESYGVATGCRHSPPRSANFSGKGYLELRAMPLKDHSNLSFSFSTRQSEAILLVSLFKRSTARATQNTVSVQNMTVLVTKTMMAACFFALRPKH